MTLARLASVRKRTWTTQAGEQREAWIVVYTHNGRRHIETFERKKDADARHAEVKVDMKVRPLAGRRLRHLLVP